MAELFVNYGADKKLERGLNMVLESSEGWESDASGKTMKVYFVFVLAMTVFGSVPATAYAAADHAVKGHMTKRGTYVAPTRATNPNSTQRDNYGSKANINPATGRPGTRTPKR